MKAILQVSTGRFGQCTERSVSEVRSRLEQMLKWLPVTAVIFGWARKDGLFEAIADTAHANGADVYLWLPVYADVRDPAQADPMVFRDADHAGDRNVPVMDGEGFHFICPASGKNLDSAFRTWADLAEGISVEGVFLDRIRYPSAVFSKVHFFGCRCPNCLRRLDGQIRDREKLRRLIRDADQSTQMPLPVSVENGCCRYADEDLNRLMADRRGQITQAVERIVRSFHEKGLRVVRRQDRHIRSALPAGGIGDLSELDGHAAALAFIEVKKADPLDDVAAGQDKADCHRAPDVAKACYVDHLAVFITF